jgi:hypothetical protein
MVTVNVPGERWEVEFMDEGTVEIERFSEGVLHGEELIAELFARFSDWRPALVRSPAEIGAAQGEQRRCHSLA